MMSAMSLTSCPLLQLDWGHTRYRDATQRQLEQVEQRLTGTVGDALIFTEHEPVYTVGRRQGAEVHLLWNETQRRDAGVELETTNRGGDITYHGPGQIVGYPIVDLSSRRDLHAYLRCLEQVLIDTVAEFGVSAERRPGLTGIWVEDRKLAAIGVAVRRWIAYHGFALNVAPDLRHFEGIVPCGIQSTQGTVTSLARELGRPVALEQVKPMLAERFQRAWVQFLAGA